MNKASLLATAAIASVAFAAAPAFAQQGPSGPFADVPTDHWAYASVDTLQKAGIVIGYPDQTYGGKRAMTRYEFAVAIARLLAEMERRAALTPRVGPDRTDMSEYVKRSELAGLATKEEVDAIRRLVNEFQTELTTLGVDLDATKRRVDALEGRMTALENIVKRVQVGGALNIMARGNHRTATTSPYRSGNLGGVIDNDGFRVTGGRGSRGGILSDTRALHDFDLNITARLSETATAEAILNFGNYLDFLGGIASFNGARSDRNGAGLYPGQTVSQNQEQTVYKLAIEAPIRLPGLGGVNLTVGRVPLQFTPYTLKLVDTDSYFYNAKTDLGDIPVDGAKGTFNLGAVGVTAFAAKVDPIRYVSNINGKLIGDPNYALYAGAGRSPFAGGFQGNNQATIDDNGFGTTTGNRPVGSVISQGSTTPQFRPANGAMPIEQMAGVRAVLGTSSIGTIGGTFIAAGGPSPANGFNGSGLFQTAAGVNSNANFERVFIYGGDINTQLGPIGIQGSFTKTDTYGTRAGSTNTAPLFLPDGTVVPVGTAVTTIDGDVESKRDEDNFAWDIAGAYTTGALNLGLGYKYIQPFFAAPGYWGRVGSWVNPVDLKGVYFSGSYALGGGFTLGGMAQFLEGTGDGTAADGGGLTSDDGVNNYKFGLKYGLTSASTFDLGMEYTEYELNSPGVIGGRRGGNPREIFYNLGFGYSFNPTTSFKLLYQIVDYNDKDSGFDTLNGRGGIGAAQFSVKF